MTLIQERVLLTKTRERVKIVISRLLVVKSECDLLLGELYSLQAQLATEELIVDKEAI